MYSKLIFILSILFLFSCSKDNCEESEIIAGNSNCKGNNIESNYDLILSYPNSDLKYEIDLNSDGENDLLIRLYVGTSLGAGTGKSCSISPLNQTTQIASMEQSRLKVNYYQPYGQSDSTYVTENYDSTFSYPQNHTIESYILKTPFYFNTGDQISGYSNFNSDTCTIWFENNYFYFYGDWANYLNYLEGQNLSNKLIGMRYLSDGSWKYGWIEISTTTNETTIHRYTYE